jgi:hypothetical protein
MVFLQRILAYVKLHWATVIMLLAAIWTYAKPTVLNFVTNHPQYSFWFGLAGVIITFYWRSPLPSQGGAPLPPSPLAPVAKP